MKNPLSMSTGCLWRLLKDDSSFTDESIKRLKNLPINGVELNLGGTERFTNVGLSKETIIFLKKLSHNTIHFPSIIENEEITLNKVEKIYKKINAKNVIFHPTDLKDFNLLSSYEFKSSIENKDSRESFCTVEKVKAFLKKHQPMNFIFDIAHGYDVYKDNALIFLDELSDRLVECHLSILNDWRHWFTHLSKVDDLMKRFAKKITKEIILVNEAAVMNKEQISLLKNEIEYLRNL